MKRSLSETDICMKYITPALQQAGWDIHTEIFREAPLNELTKGRVWVRGQMHHRGKLRRADYILVHRNIPLAVIEAKATELPLSAGMQQALDYAERLDLLFAYSSNGTGFHEHDRTMANGELERELRLDEFPSPAELWGRYEQYKGISEEADITKIVTQPYFEYPDGKQPRYYQLVAINRTVEAIAKGQNRILLVMATGTGKTLTAFQIIWRLWKAGIKKRILFLADRNILLDQARTGDFRYFQDKMTTVRNHKVEKHFEIYLALYQGLTGQSEADNIYQQFSPDFFDLVIIDECHRGSAAEASNWRQILDYFQNATHIGLTATPKETRDVSNIHYFGEPVYTYSLKQGIQDGFLAPYKVIRLDIDRDVLGWRPENGQLDIYGNVVPDREYNSRDFDRNLVIDNRTRLVAKRVSDYLKMSDDRFAKTIVFCVDIEHAERMRVALANENADLMRENPKYVMRITGDNPEGKAQLDNFIDPDARYPVIATTSKLLTTGVDAQTCKLIVLDAPIESMTEFKQIIGRGTRIREDKKKTFFTILDCRNVTRLFADPEFDGEPVMVYEPGMEEDIVPPMVEEPPPPSEEIVWEAPDPDELGPATRKLRVAGVEVTILRERVQYLDAHGKLITESLRDYSRKNLRKEFESLDAFLSAWHTVARKQELIEALEEQGILLHELQDLVNKDLDIFDLICHVAFDQPPLTRRERVERVKKRHYFAKYGEQARQVLDALLDKYADQGIEEIDTAKVLQLDPFRKMGTVKELIGYFGAKDDFVNAIRELQRELYKTAG